MYVPSVYKVPPVIAPRVLMPLELIRVTVVLAAMFDPVINCLKATWVL